MPKKKGGKKSKGVSFADPSHCVNVFGVAPGAQLITPAGCQVKVVGMGDKDESLYALFPGNYTTALGDTDGNPVADCEGLLDAGYKLNRQYIREMVHVIDGQWVVDPKMPREHDATMFEKNSETTGKMLDDLFSAAHVPSEQLKGLSLLSGKEKQRKQRLLISEMPEAVLLPRIRDVLQDPHTGPANIRKILRMDRMSQLKNNSPHKESVLQESKTAIFDITQATSPQRLTALNAALVAKEYFSKPENRDEKANLRWMAKCYFDRHYDPLLLPPIVKDYFEANPVEPPAEKKGQKGKSGGGKKKKK